MIEVYAYDPAPWQRFFRSLGFQALPTGQSTRMHGGGTAVMITPPLTAGSPVAQWIERHGGPGCAGVWIPAPDLLAATDAAEAAGCERVGAHAVSIAGAEYNFTGPFTANKGPFQCLDHVAHAVAADEMDGVAALYQKGFGASWEPMPDLTVGTEVLHSGVIRLAGLTVTLVAPGGYAGHLAGFLDANRGPGIQHAAFRVPDIVSTVLETSVAGAQYLHTPGSYYDALPGWLGYTPDDIYDLRATGVLQDRDELGSIRQIFTMAPVGGRPFFTELIQRDGGTGFGRNNIRALYEAKAQDHEGAAK